MFAWSLALVPSAGGWFLQSECPPLGWGGGRSVWSPKLRPRMGLGAGVPQNLTCQPQGLHPDSQHDCQEGILFPPLTPGRRGSPPGDPAARGMSPGPPLPSDRLQWGGPPQQLRDQHSPPPSCPAPPPTLGGLGRPLSLRSPALPARGPWCS